MLTRAANLYNEALTHFADAYCIQFRLAQRLAELGDNAGAEEHYRRAYELMPGSFGRVESFCLECERAFAGLKEQNIAEKAFSKLAAKMPQKPQVHYMLGYLRNEEERYRDALPEFEQAVKLDPDYLNAWIAIGGLEEQMHLPPKLCNEVALNELRLDPLRRHCGPDVDGATDLSALWDAVETTKGLAPVVPDILFSLKASAEQVGMRFQPYGNGADWSQYSQRNEARQRDPADCISRNRFINAVNQMFSSLANSFPR